MKVLVAPLNWGLGHAARCVPLIERYLETGDEVVLGGDGESLLLLRRHFPHLRVLPLGALTLRYSSGDSQVGAMLKGLPQILRSAIKDHRLLRQRLAFEHFDLVVSDNRFGLFWSDTRCVYITHQLHIPLPRAYRWLEPCVSALHGLIYRQYDEVWVPDYADMEQCLSGKLGHPHKVYTPHVVYINPLSRFARIKTSVNTEEINTNSTYDVVAVLSGLEPQRSLLEEEVIRRYQHTNKRVLIVEGILHKPPTVIQKDAITIVPYMDDSVLAKVLLAANKIIARAGYSTIMDFATLDVLHKAELIATPGQPEQMYLQDFVHNRL